LGEARIRFSVAIPDLQIGQNLAIVIPLRRLLAAGLADPVGARKQPVEVIETPVLGIENDDGFYLRKISGRNTLR
jgi:hypothetical protein